MPHGVGIIGAGPGVSALHLPTLARLSDQFTVRRITDAGSGRAVLLAARVDARASSNIEDVLDDDTVSVVLLASPPAEHAAQILSAVTAGKRAILCEKPLATTIEDAESAVAACRDAGVALVVGTNHLYDPAWGRAKHHLLAGQHRVRALSVTLSLPPNDRYHDVVTEMTPSGAAPRRGGPDLSIPAVAASVVRQLITGLAIHDLPMLRDLAPTIEHIVFARAVAPLGFTLGYRASGIPVRLSTVMLAEGADALWRIDITTDSDRVQVSFPPAFVHAGSAFVHVSAGDGRETTYPVEPGNGYVAEWASLADALDGSSVIEYDEMLDDARYAIALADAASEFIENGRSS